MSEWTLLPRVASPEMEALEVTSDLLAEGSQMLALGKPMTTPGAFPVEGFAE